MFCTWKSIVYSVIHTESLESVHVGCIAIAFKQPVMICEPNLKEQGSLDQHELKKGTNPNRLLFIFDLNPKMFGLDLQLLLIILGFHRYACSLSNFFNMQFWFLHPYFITFCISFVWKTLKAYANTFFMLCLLKDCFSYICTLPTVVVTFFN